MKCSRGDDRARFSLRLCWQGHSRTGVSLGARWKIVAGASSRSSYLLSLLPAPARDTVQLLGKCCVIYFPVKLTMAEFICRLGTPAGEVVTRTIEATGVQEARARLEREGFRVFNVTPPKTTGVAALTRFGRSGAHPRVKANDFLLFNQQLAALVRAGIPILQAISMLRKRAASARLRTVLGEVEEQIRGGAALSQAFAFAGTASSHESTRPRFSPVNDRARSTRC